VVQRHGGAGHGAAGNTQHSRYSKASTRPHRLDSGRVPLADYPQLRALAWQVHGTDTLTPAEALGIYERNARHLDMQAMSANELALLQALRLALSPSAKTDTGASDAV
jgi:hypothetical protein